jgi:hypothetical protein
VSADLDRDGDRDIIVANTTFFPADAAVDGKLEDLAAGRPLLIENPAGDANRWLAVRLAGRGAAALGAAVTVVADGQTQVQVLRSGSSSFSQDTSELNFGLGAAAVADVTVRWPDGTVTAHPGIAAGQVLRLEHGQE